MIKNIIIAILSLLLVIVSWQFALYQDIAEPEAGWMLESLPWSKLPELLASGMVREVSQVHDLNVWIYLENGEVLKTREPEMDAIFSLISDCGKPCAQIPMATE